MKRKELKLQNVFEFMHNKFPLNTTEQQNHRQSLPAVATATEITRDKQNKDGSLLQT